MSKLAIVPSFRVKESSFSPYAVLALDLAKVSGSSISEVRVLTENAPLALDWAQQENTKAPRVAVEAVWPREDNDVPDKKVAAKIRNEALLSGVELIFVYGKVETHSMQAVMRRAFGSPRFTVVQVMLGVAKIVGSTTIECAAGYEIGTVRAEADIERAYVDPFGGDAKPAVRKSAKK